MSDKDKKCAVILLAEDDPGDQELIRRAFAKSQVRNQLIVVENGQEVFEYLHGQGRFSAHQPPRPDLILLDLNMPKLDGKEVLKRLKQSPALHRIPVVVLTTSRHHEDIVCSYDLGANSYITKPLKMEHLVDVVKKLSVYWFDTVQLPPHEEQLQ